MIEGNVEKLSVNPLEFVSSQPITPWLRLCLMDGYQMGIFSDQDLIRVDQYSQLESDLEVAGHEEGHALSLIFSGGIMHYATIVPEGRSSGYAVGRANPNHSVKDQQHDLVRFGMGGFVAEKKFMGKSDHRGCGSDFGNSRNRAERMSAIFYGGAVSADKIISDEISANWAIFRSVSETNFRRRTLTLYQRKTVTY